MSLGNKVSYYSLFFGETTVHALRTGMKCVLLAAGLNGWLCSLPSEAIGSVPWLPDSLVKLTRWLGLDTILINRWGYEQ